MGKNDSSISVVIPMMRSLGSSVHFNVELFEAILNAMHEGSRKLDFNVIGNVSKVCYRDDYHNVNEISLRPSKERLEDMIKHAYDRHYLTEEIITKSRVADETANRRRALISDDLTIRERMVAEALKEINNWHKENDNNQYKVYPQSLWWALEGSSKPDIFIETSNYIFVGEAKRTEPNVTKNIEYDPERQQLVRHVEGACIYKTHHYGSDDSRVVVSFYVLDDEFVSNDKSKHNTLKLTASGDSSMWDDSLKHYANQPDMINMIKNSYIGYVTVNQLRKLGIQFPY